MAKIVINIPDETYEYIKLNYKYGIGAKVACDLGFAVAEGTVLPKGHERLISIGDLDITKLVDSDIEWVMGRCDISRVQDMIDNAPTIIEADKESIDEDN